MISSVFLARLPVGTRFRASGAARLDTLSAAVFAFAPSLDVQRRTHGSASLPVSELEGTLFYVEIEKRFAESDVVDSVLRFDSVT